MTYVASSERADGDAAAAAARAGCDGPHAGPALRAGGGATGLGPHLAQRGRGHPGHTEPAARDRALRWLPVGGVRRRRHRRGHRRPGGPARVGRRVGAAPALPHGRDGARVRATTGSGPPSSCTSGPGRSRTASTRWCGRSTRWYAATPGSTSSSSASQRPSTCRTSTARCPTRSTPATPATGCWRTGTWARSGSRPRSPARVAAPSAADLLRRGAVRVLARGDADEPVPSPAAPTPGGPAGRAAGGHRAAARLRPRRRDRPGGRRSGRSLLPLLTAGGVVTGLTAEGDYVVAT